MTAGEESEMVACTRPAVIWVLSFIVDGIQQAYHLLQLGDYLICGLGARCRNSCHKLIDSQSSIKRLGLEDFAFQHRPDDLMDQASITVLRHQRLTEGFQKDLLTFANTAFSSSAILSTVSQSLSSNALPSLLYIPFAFSTARRTPSAVAFGNL
jgi:hypothetical protein